MRLKRFLFVLTILSLLGNITVGQNRLNSRLFYQRPPLYYSKSKVDNFDLSKYTISVSMPVDNRSQFYGVVAYKNKKVQRLDEFFQAPTMIEIQKKIKKDIIGFGMNGNMDTTKTNIKINTVVEVFYPDVRGFLWGKSFAKVRLILTASSKDTILINNKYESFYITDGTDKEFEGSIIMTIEQGANVTIGMALRKALDELYNELKEKIKNYR